MKKTQKKILGFFGLVVVAALTAVAINMPLPNSVSAATNRSFTDNLSVKVVNGDVYTKFISPTSGDVFLTPDQTIEYEYENTKSITVTMTYTDVDGNTTTHILIDHYPTSPQTGSGSLPIDLSGTNFGYGEYTITITGEGETQWSQDTLAFSFYPLTANVTEDENSGDAIVKLDYADDNDDIDKIMVNVYDGDGNIISELSPIIVDKGTKEITIPFSEYGNILEGDYRIEVTALGADGAALYKPYTLTFKYTPRESVPVPNTGGIMGNLNISQTDYLITGVVIFFILTGIGVYIVAKRR